MRSLVTRVLRKLAALIGRLADWTDPIKFPPVEVQGGGGPGEEK
jgi:hypothetical protein